MSAQSEMKHADGEIVVTPTDLGYDVQQAPALGDGHPLAILSMHELGGGHTRVALSRVVVQNEAWLPRLVHDTETGHSAIVDSRHNYAEKLPFVAVYPVAGKEAAQTAGRHIFEILAMTEMGGDA